MLLIYLYLLIYLLRYICLPPSCAYPQSRRYITGARGHELSGRVRAHAMPGLNARVLQSKLLITPLSE